MKNMLCRAPVHGALMGCLLWIVLNPGVLRADHATAERYLARIGAGPTTRDNAASRLAVLRQWEDDMDRPGSLSLDLVTMAQGRFMEKLHLLTPKECSAIDRMIAGMTLLTDSQGRLGSFSWKRAGLKAVVGEMATLPVVYQAGRDGLKQGAQIWIGVHYSYNLGAFQWQRPGHAGYVRIESDGDVAFAMSRPRLALLPFYLAKSASQVLITLKEGELKPGATVTISIGDMTQHGPGIQLARKSGPMSVDCFVMPDAMSGMVPVDRLSIPLAPQAPERMYAVVPSRACAGERVDLKLRICDRYRNPVSEDMGCSLAVWLNDTCIKQTDALRVEGGVVTLTDLRAPMRPGTYYFVVREGRTGLACRSNPMQVREALMRQLYWGEFHGHTGYTDGIGTPEEYFRYAREDAFLDVAVLTDHDILMSQAEWANIVHLAHQYNRDGAFVTFCGYEWTQHFLLGGHHNVFFKGTKTAYVSKYDFPSPDKLYAELKRRVPDEQCLVIPHAHNPGDWQYADPDLQRIVEIYSKHGTFEWYGQRYLDTGARLAFIAASDDHVGRPGWGPLTAPYYSPHGLTAVYADALTRDAIWAALRDRRVYATTGERIVLDFRMDRHPMGSVVYTDARARHIEASVQGTAGIHALDILRNGRVVRSYAGETLPAGDEDDGCWIALHLSSGTAPAAFARPLPISEWNITIRSDATIRHGLQEGFEPFDKLVLSDTRKEVQYRGHTRGDVDILILELESPGRLVIEDETGRRIQVTEEDVRSGKELALSPFRERIPRRIHCLPYARRRDTLRVQFEDRTEIQNECNYRVRVLQQNGHRAWSSPIWVLPKRARFQGGFEKAAERDQKLR